MMENEEVFSGYFLGLLPDKHDGHNVIKVACFKSGSTYRKLWELQIDIECDYQYGELIHFRSINPLKNKSLIKIEDDPNQTYQRAENLPERIIYTVRDFQVSSNDIVRNHYYWHPELGEMDISDHPMVSGAYYSLVFEVILHEEQNSFELKVHSNEVQPRKKQQEEITERQRFEQKAKLYPEILKLEKEHNVTVEAEYWKEIGLMKLKKVDERELIGGVRAIFRMLDENKNDEHKLEMFENRKDAYPVVIIKQCKEDGQYVDHEEMRFEGTLFPRQNHEGKVRRHECIVQLKKDEQKRFYGSYKENEIYRFDSLPVLKFLNFWEQQKQNENEIYRLTLEETSNPEPLQLLDVIDSAMRDPLELAATADKNTPKNDLNDSQLTAVKMALNDQRPLVCIQGPPGTGKSHTLSMLLFKILKLKQQAIVLTPTKEALKNLREMTQKLCERRKRELNLHPYAFMDIKMYHQLINQSEEAIEAVKHFIDLKEQCQNGEKSVDDIWEERENRLQTIKTKVGGEILKNVRVVFATIESSFTKTVMQNKAFMPSYCIIDEAAQVMESQMWPAVHKMKKIVMAGDPKQLPALVLTEEAKQFGLSQSVMERIISKKEHFSWIMLQEQYRSHKDITDWSNGCFYHCKLINNTSIEDVLMNDLDPKPTQYPKLYSPKVLIDTSCVTDGNKRSATYELRNDRAIGEKQASYINRGEAEYAIQHYKNLITMSIKPETIAILAPYKGQVEELKIKMKALIASFQKENKDYGCHKTMIGTVDSVQGQEYDVVIFTFVRSNPKKTIGFVAEIRRLNVAVTRAKRHFMLIANGYMLLSSHDEKIRALFNQLRYKKARFHPANLYGEPGPVPEEPTNNFGYNFEDFIANSNDKDMIDWCNNYVANGKDPLFQEQQRERKKQRELLKEMTRMRHVESQIKNITFSNRFST